MKSFFSSGVKFYSRKEGISEKVKATMKWQKRVRRKFSCNRPCNEEQEEEAYETLTERLQCLNYPGLTCVSQVDPRDRWAIDMAINHLNLTRHLEWISLQKDSVEISWQIKRKSIQFSWMCIRNWIRRRGNVLTSVTKNDKMSLFPEERSGQRK